MSLAQGSIYNFNEQNNPGLISPSVSASYHNQLYKILQANVADQLAECEILTGPCKDIRASFYQNWFDPLPSSIAIDLVVQTFVVKGISQDSMTNTVNRNIIPYYYNVNRGDFTFNLKDWNYIMTNVIVSFKPKIPSAPIPCDCPLKVVMSVGCANKGHC